MFHLAHVERNDHALTILVVEGNPSVAIHRNLIVGDRVQIGLRVLCQSVERELVAKPRWANMCCGSTVNHHVHVVHVHVVGGVQGCNQEILKGVDCLDHRSAAAVAVVVVVLEVLEGTAVVGTLGATVGATVGRSSAAVRCTS